MNPQVWLLLGLMLLPAVALRAGETGVGTVNPAVYRALPETEADFNKLLRGVETAVQRFNTGDRGGDVAALVPALLKLEAAVQRETAFSIPRFSDSESVLDVIGSLFFGQYPVLPPEIKDGEHWRFETIRFDVKPRHMYVFAVSFKASRTIRLKSVTLVFRDGSKIVHQPWEKAGDGNGEAFRKRLYLPWFNVYERNETRVAKPLAAVEILGSAQDAGFEALLDFRVKIPDIEAEPHAEMLAQLARMKRDWARRPLNAETLNLCLTEMRTLARYLSVPFNARVVAVQTP